MEDQYFHNMFNEHIQNIELGTETEAELIIASNILIKFIKKIKRCKKQKEDYDVKYNEAVNKIRVRTAIKYYAKKKFLGLTIKELNDQVHDLIYREKKYAIFLNI